MFIRKRLHEFRATSRFFFNVHLDGLEETHDRAVEREGVFRAAVDGIRAAKDAGFLVCTNTTVYKETDLGEIDALFAYLTRLGVGQSDAQRARLEGTVLPDYRRAPRDVRRSHGKNRLG